MKKMPICLNNKMFVLVLIMMVNLSELNPVNPEIGGKQYITFAN